MLLLAAGGPGCSSTWAGVSRQEVSPSRSRDTDITRSTWDHRNRLARVEHFADHAAFVAAQPDQVVEYAYDFGNRWVRKVLDSDGNGTPNTSTIFVHDGTDGAGAP